MTDRVKGFTVTLENDIREDYVEVILNAIKMVKGVATVEPVKATTHDQIIKTRVTLDLRKKFYDFMNENLK